MSKPQWISVLIISLIFGIGSFSLGSLAGWSVWRSLESIGVQSFITTGEVFQKEVNEKTGRRSYKKIIKTYAVFKSEDDKYRYEDQISPSQKLAIKKGKRYSKSLDVAVDRYGDYVVSTIEQGEQRGKNSWNLIFIFFGVSAVFFALSALSWKKIRLIRGK